MEELEKLLEQLVSAEARHRVARVLTSRDLITTSETLAIAQEKDRHRIRTLSQHPTEHTEADCHKFLRLRCAELMFSFHQAANIASEYGDAERIQAYELLAETLGVPSEALNDYLNAKNRSPDDAYAHATLRAFSETT